MSEKKQKSLNLRLSEEEKKKLEESANTMGLRVSEYVRLVLFEGVSNETQSNTNVLQDEELCFYKNELESKNQQIKELHRLLENQQTLLLNTQKENQLLLELDEKKWWQFWK